MQRNDKNRFVCCTHQVKPKFLQSRTKVSCNAIYLLFFTKYDLVTKSWIVKNTFVSQERDKFFVRRVMKYIQSSYNAEKQTTIRDVVKLRTELNWTDWSWLSYTMKWRSFSALASFLLHTRPKSAKYKSLSAFWIRSKHQLLCKIKTKKTNVRNGIRTDALIEDQNTRT